MKYINADKLIAKIEKRKGYISVTHFAEELLSFIDSLQQEQPDVNFKIEERKWVHNAVDNIFPEDGDFMSEVGFRKTLKDTALYFYRLGLNARKEE